MVSCLLISARMPDHISSTIVAHLASSTASPVDITRVDKKLFTQIVQAQGSWAAPMDEQLVRYASQLAQSKSKGMIELSPPEFVVKSELLDRYPLLENVREADVRARFVILQELNRRLAHCIEFIDMSDGGRSPGAASMNANDGSELGGWSIGSRLRRMSHVIFPDAKARLVEAALDASFIEHQHPFSMQLDNTKAFQM